ncbi:MAG: succinate dehydrogenase assembly factor 2 [Pseudomonadota bacterium]
MRTRNINEQSSGNDCNQAGPTSPAEADADYRQMCWASRRGMLELDLVLEPFVRDHYLQLTNDEKATYRALMECQDQELFDWFLNKSPPADLALEQMVDRILAAKRSDR